MGLRCNGSSRPYLDQLACELTGESPKSLSKPSGSKRNHFAENMDGFCESFSKAVSNCITDPRLNSVHTDGESTIITRSSSKKSRVSKSSNYETIKEKPTPKRESYSRSNSNGFANSYAKIADELSGSKKAAKPKSNSCSWHSGINSAISRDKRDRIAKSLSWMEKRYEDKKPDIVKKPENNLLSSMDDRISRLMIYDLPHEVRNEIEGLCQDLEQLRENL